MASAQNDFIGTAKQTFADFSEDECPMMAAALAYYTAFSLPPLLVVIVTVSGWIWSAEAAKGQLEQQVSSVLGQGGWQQIETMMQAAREKGGGGIAAIVGVVALLFGATGVMVQLQASLNKAWEVQPDPQSGGVKNFVIKRVLSLGMILAVAFLLLVSLVLTAVLSSASQLFAGWLPQSVAGWLPATIDFVVSLVVFTLLFAAMFKWLPDADIRWKDTWIGATTTAVLFMVGKLLLGMYFGMADTGGYGAATSFALLLLWVYYSGLIFLLGAEFTQTWAKRQGRQIAPEEGAVRVVRQTRHERIETSRASGARQETTKTHPDGRDAPATKETSPQSRQR